MCTYAYIKITVLSTRQGGGVSVEIILCKKPESRNNKKSETICSQDNKGGGEVLRMKVESSRLQCAKPGYELGLDDLAVNLTIMLQKPDNLDPEVQT